MAYTILYVFVYNIYTHVYSNLQNFTIFFLTESNIYHLNLRSNQTWRATFFCQITQGLKVLWFVSCLVHRSKNKMRSKEGESERGIICICLYYREEAAATATTTRWCTEREVETISCTHARLQRRFLFATSKHMKKNYRNYELKKINDYRLYF